MLFLAAGEQHVAGLDVAVDEPAAVRGVECRGDLADDPHCALRLSGPSRMRREQVRASTKRIAM